MNCCLFKVQILINPMFGFRFLRSRVLVTIAWLVVNNLLRIWVKLLYSLSKVFLFVWFDIWEGIRVYYDCDNYCQKAYFEVLSKHNLFITQCQPNLEWVTKLANIWLTHSLTHILFTVLRNRLGKHFFTTGFAAKDIPQRALNIDVDQLFQ